MAVKFVVLQNREKCNVI